MLLAGATSVVGLHPVRLAALQFAEHSESGALSKQLHSAANDPQASAAAAAALRQYREGGPGALLPSGGGASTVQLMLMSAMVAGVDVKRAPLRLKPADVMLQARNASAGAASSGDAAAAAAALASDLDWLRSQQHLYARQAGLQGDSGLAVPPNATRQQQLALAPLYRLMHKHCTELQRMRSAGKAAFACHALPPSGALRCCAQSQAAPPRQCRSPPPDPSGRGIARHHAPLL